MEKYRISKMVLLCGPSGKRAQNGKKHVKELKIETKCASQKWAKKEDTARIKGKERVCPNWQQPV